MNKADKGYAYASEQFSKGRAIHELHMEAQNHPNSSGFKLGMLRFIVDRQTQDLKEARNG